MNYSWQIKGIVESKEYELAEKEKKGEKRE